MRRFLKSRRADIGLEKMFETRSEAWAAAGLHVEVNPTVVRRARQRLIVIIPLLIATILLLETARNHIDDLAHRHPPQNWVVGKAPVTLAAVLLVLLFGWLISRDLSRIAPAFFRRMDPSTAGTVEFLVRFVAVAATVLGALAVAGISLQALAVGGAFTAVVLGLAAQQTLGNLFAGMVLLSARPFRLGERVRLQAGAVGGTIEGVVSGLGLLYTTLSRGENRVLIPNNVVLSSAVLPLREPDPVDVRVRLGAGARPSQVQQMLDASVSVPTRNPPAVMLEEIGGGSTIVRVRATPSRSRDGARLADQIIAALAGMTAEEPAVSQSDGAA